MIGSTSVLARLAPKMPPTGSKAAPDSGSQPPSKKRKMDVAEPKYYAVRAGFKPGVYSTWAICQQQISGFKGAQCMAVFFLPSSPPFSPFPLFPLPLPLPSSPAE